MASVASRAEARPAFIEKYQKWIVAFVLFGMYASFGLSWMGVVPLRDTINEMLGVGPADGQRLVSIVSMAKSFFPILAGILAGRWGLTKTMRLSSLLIMTSLITPFLPGYWVWVGMKFIFGIGGAIWVTLMGAVTMQVFEPEHRPLVNALNGVAITIGVIASLKLTPPLIAMLGGNWKLALSLYALVSGLFMALLFWVGDLAPQSDAQAGAEKASQVPMLTILKSYAGTLKLPVTWLTSIGFAGPLALYLVFSYWLPVYHKDIGIATPASLSLMSWMNLGAIVGAVGTGLLMQRVGRTKPFIVIAAILIPLASLGAVHLAGPDSKFLMPIMIITGIALFIPVSPLVTLLQAQPGLTPTLVGMILGTMFSITYILSYMAPEIVGRAYHAHAPLQWVLSIFCLATVSPIVAVFLKEHKAEPQEV